MFPFIITNFNCTYIPFTVASGSSFNSKHLSLRIQKKIAGKFSTKSMAKNFIDEEFSKLLDLLHFIVMQEMGEQKAEKLIKNLIKLTVKIGILYKNSQFNDEELQLGVSLRKKLRTATLTVISFYEVDFTYDCTFLVNLVEEIGTICHKLVQRHLTPKSHGRIDMVISVFSNGELLDKVFLSDGQYRDKLPQISQAFNKVVDSDW